MDVGGGSIMLLELDEYLVCFKVDPLSFCLYSSCVSFQVVGNWDQLDDEGREHLWPALALLMAFRF